MTVPCGREIDFCHVDDIGEFITFNNPCYFLVSWLIAENTNCDQKYSSITYILADADDRGRDNERTFLSETDMCV